MQTSARIAAGIAVQFAMLAAASAQDATPPTRGAVMIFPGNLEEAAPPDGVEAPKTRGWHIAGKRYVAGDGWRALACSDGEHCTVAALRLDVQDLAIQPHDDEAEAAQFLTWQPQPEGTPLLFFNTAGTGERRIDVPPGPVRTFLWPGAAQVRFAPVPDGVGSMAAAIPLGDGASALLVPRLAKSSDPDRAGDEVRIELRAYGKRQTLGHYEWYEGAGNGMGVIGARDYLIWAGDLDGDGRIDLLMNWRDYDIGQTLYLSSLAHGDEIVGEAGAFFYWPPQIGD